MDDDQENATTENETDGVETMPFAGMSGDDVTRYLMAQLDAYRASEHKDAGLVKVGGGAIQF